MTGDEQGVSMGATSECEGPSGAYLAACVAKIAATGDVKAFEVLFVHFAPRLRSYMMRMGASEDSAEDLAQEAMTSLWHRAGSYNPQTAAVSTWLFTIARNLRIDRLRRARMVEVPLDPQHTEPMSGALQQDAQADAARLCERIATLPPDQAEVLQLVYLEGLSHSEISKRLAQPLGTVKSRLRRALAALRQQAGEV